MKSFRKYGFRVNRYWVWSCGALFYMYQFALRVSPGVLVNELMETFQIDATAVGVLTAMAMYSYSLLQIPSGVLADRFGVRRVMMGSLSLCVLGILIFASSSKLWMAQMGRLILGAGSAAAFLSVSKISHSYFPPTKRASIFGLTMAAGTVGALNGGAPLCYLVARIGWRESLYLLGTAGLIVICMVGLLVRENDSNLLSSGELKKASSEPRITEAFMKVITNRKVWSHAFVAIGLYLSISVLADLWGPSFLMQRFSINKKTASEVVSLTYLGLFAGSILVPFVSDFLKIRRAMMIGCTLAICTLLLVFIYVPVSLITTSIVLFLIGFFGGAEMLCFAGACESASSSVTATVTGLVNGVVMLSVAFTEHAIGKLLDYYWKGLYLNEIIPLYSTDEFQSALVILPAVAGLSFFVSLTIKDQTNQHSILVK